ncbi:MAG: hypothetical protein HC918_03265 [Oscillatoriales cyanobacterium SM2_1_8]|nr:hypothetical protein [Oscillatoriales cyanobacterium SM2_1_8]
MAKAYQTKVFLWDRGAITGSDRHLWQHVQDLGSSWLAATTLQELENLARDVGADRGGGTSVEALADAFLRFYESSGWRLTEVNEGHPQFQVLEGAGRKALDNLASARTAWGLSRQHPQALIILVSADATFVRKLNELNLENLRAATAISLRAWQGNRNAPPAIATALGLTLDPNMAAAGARSRRSRAWPWGWILVGATGIGAIGFWYTQPRLSQQIWQTIQRAWPKGR